MVVGVKGGVMFAGAMSTAAGHLIIGVLGVGQAKAELAWIGPFNVNAFKSGIDVRFIQWFFLGIGFCGFFVIKGVVIIGTNGFVLLRQRLIFVAVGVVTRLIQGQIAARWP